MGISSIPDDYTSAGANFDAGGSRTAKTSLESFAVPFDRTISFPAIRQAPPEAGFRSSITPETLFLKARIDGLILKTPRTLLA
jgi:hypothetical protein